jgi:hypothetical protein
VPTWYSGNIYDLEQAPPQIIDLPAIPSAISPTTYDIFVSGDYEVVFSDFICSYFRTEFTQIRLFGDPRAYSVNDTPVLSINVAIEVENPVEEVVRDRIQDVTCDFVDGFAFGEALGFGLRSVDGWWTVKNVTLTSDVNVRAMNYAYNFPTNFHRAYHCIFYEKPPLLPHKRASYLSVLYNQNASSGKNYT